MSQRRFLGHFIIALRIDCFQDKAVFKRNMSRMMNELRSGPRSDEDIPIMVAGDPEKEAEKKRTKEGIPYKENEYKELKRISREYGVALKI
jgi:LDH2 family malate/lactate/ureidoglycolate dehydrogenase